MAQLAETSRTACSSFTPAGVREMGFWPIKLISCFITKMKAMMHKLRGCPFLYRLSLLWIKKGKCIKKGLSVSMFSEDSGICSDLWSGWGIVGISHLLGVSVHSALTVGKQPMCGGFCLGTGLITVGWEANCCTFNLCRPHPHNTRALSWMAAITLAPLHMQTLLQWTFSPSNFSSSSSLF